MEISNFNLVEIGKKYGKGITAPRGHSVWGPPTPSLEKTYPHGKIQGPIDQQSNKASQQTNNNFGC